MRFQAITLKILILDARSFMEYNTSHIGKSVNIGGDRVFRRKLCEFPVVLSSLISAIVGIPASDIREFRGVILYDQCSDDQDALRSNVFISFLLSTLSSFFPNTLLLKGGFLGFRAAYPGLCWEHSEKLPGEEYVHVLKDCCLGTTLDRCLSELPAEAVASPQSAAPFTTSFCVTHVRIPSTPSSSNSEISSFSSSDSGVGSSSSTDISRPKISRPASVPMSRPSLGSLDCLNKARVRRRPATLAFCPIFRAYHYQKIHRLTSEQVSNSSRCTSPGPGASQYEDAFKPAATPVARPNPFRQSTRDPLLPYGQHSAFKPTDGESVPPTRILPHLVIGSQADAMSAETCRQFGITHVINVSADGPASPHIPLENFFRIPIQDNFTDQITPFFDRAFMMINSARASQGCVLIHCAAGISRSPTVAIAYLMQTSKLTLEAAYKQVKSCRPSVAPNFNFLGQLTAFEQQLSLQSDSARPRALSSGWQETATTSATSESSSSSSAAADGAANASSTSCSSVSVKVVYRSVSASRLPSPKSSLIPVQQSTTETTTQACQVVRRPTLRLDEPSSQETRTCPLIRTTKATNAPQKRERPKHLSLYPTASGDNLVSRTPSADDVDGQTKPDGQATEGGDPVVPSRPRKRSRISLLPLVVPGSDALLPSPCSGIAHLDLSSPSEEARKRLAMPGPPCKPNLVTVSSPPPLPQVRIVHTSPPCAPSSSVSLTDGSSPPPSSPCRRNKRPISLSVFPPGEASQHEPTIGGGVSSNSSTTTVTKAWFFNQSSECLDVKSVANSLEASAEASSSLPKAPESPPSELRSSSLEMLPSLVVADTATRSTPHPLDEASRSSSVSSGGLSVKMSKSASSPMIARRVKIEGVFLTAAAAAPVMGSLCRSSVLPMSEFPRQTLLAGGESYCRQEESCHLSTSSSLSSVQ
ncbi:hypothetical protein AAHC03_013917 [Spirometra sp. Aus1]